MMVRYGYEAAIALALVLLAILLSSAWVDIGPGFKVAPLALKRPSPAQPKNLFEKYPFELPPDKREAILSKASILGGPHVAFNNPREIVKFYTSARIKSTAALVSDTSDVPHTLEEKAIVELLRRTDTDPARVFMQVVVSFVILGAGLTVILGKGAEPAKKHWAYGIVGTVVGFWLKG